jgi:hypothetical protein
MSSAGFLLIEMQGQDSVIHLSEIKELKTIGSLGIPMKS